ncbi:MAG: helix-turn-helix domain-containing protein [Defluviitaleaceae bacterium]|nr:helix-turn-helix domain-containing protein [Defluviitaleaceae bacterium]
MEIEKLFAKTMRLTREKLGFSQEKLAEECGLHRTYISFVERGKRNITILNVGKIAKGLQIEPYKLFMEEYLNDLLRE